MAKKGPLQSAQKVERPEHTPMEEAARRIETQRATEEDRDTTRLNAQVPTPLYERFKAKCQAEGRSMSEVLREFLTVYAAD